MDRRTLLKYFAVGTAGSSLALFRANLATGQVKEKVRWGYIGENGPENWGQLSADFKACELGGYQSPIDIGGSTKVELGEIKFFYKDSPLKIINNGHTIQVNYDSGSEMAIGCDSFNLLQFHFHNPSEHLLKGKTFEMELHLVHRNQSAENFAVVGIFIKEGKYNPNLQKIWDAIPTKEGPEQSISGVSINAESLLPSRDEFYSYSGSLTTPPCAESVRWFVFDEPIEASAEQIQTFAKVISNNARPIQPLNQRFLLEDL